MKTQTNQSTLIILSFILGYISLFLPGTIIKYQVNENTNQPDSRITIEEGFGRFFGGDQYGRDAIPCSFAHIKMPSTKFMNLLRIWLGIGSGLVILAISFASRYVVNLRIPIAKFSMLAILLMGVIPILSIAFVKEKPMCDSAVSYTMLSFTPYFPTLLILVVAIILGYSGTRAMNNPTENSNAS